MVLVILVLEKTTVISLIYYKKFEIQNRIAIKLINLKWYILRS